jgi:hypothetical protein
MGWVVIPPQQVQELADLLRVALFLGIAIGFAFIGYWIGGLGCVIWSAWRGRRAGR